jgi:Family of unknown function (DUF6011)
MNALHFASAAPVALAANATKAKAHTLDNQELITFLFGGEAIFTLLSHTGERLTYRVQKKAYTLANAPEVTRYTYWVMLLTGPHNTRDYTYLGTLSNEKQRTFELSPKSHVKDASAASVKGFQWLLKRIAGYEQNLLQTVMHPDRMSFYHAGRCGRCGRALTVPTSVESGIGPECGSQIDRGVIRNLKTTALGA